ncbi:MAG: Gfo/Idh/MocA family protein [Actinomycetes bacterium]
MTTRWGFLGTGRIAGVVAGDVSLTEGATAHAVGSRNASRARAFAEEHGFERSYGSYVDLLADPDVDVVYVATPHGQHHRDVGACLAAGKPVLVEKSFAVTAAAARDLVARARAARLFCMEAMWTRFQPLVVELRRLVADGVIGDIRAIHVDFGFVSPYDVTHRLWNPALGGGALLDVGVYPVSFAQMLLGTPASVSVVGRLAESKVDSDAALLLGWPDGAAALLSCSLTSLPSREARIVGSRGRIQLASSFHRSPALSVYRPDAEPLVVERPYTGRGYVHELEEVQRCLAAGLTESPVMPLDDTLAVIAVLDEAPGALGAVHRDEGWADPGRGHEPGDDVP